MIMCLTCSFSLPNDYFIFYLRFTSIHLYQQPIKVHKRKPHYKFKKEQLNKTIDTYVNTCKQMYYQ